MYRGAGLISPARHTASTYYSNSRSCDSQAWNETLGNKYFTPTRDRLTHAGSPGAAGHLGYLGGIHAAGGRVSWCLTDDYRGFTCYSWCNIRSVKNFYPAVICTLFPKYAGPGSTDRIGGRHCHGACNVRPGNCGDSNRIYRHDHWRFYPGRGSAYDHDHDFSGCASILARHGTSVAADGQSHWTGRPADSCKCG